MEDSSSRRLGTLLRHLASPSPLLCASKVNQCSSSLHIRGPVVIGSMVLDIHGHPLAAGLQAGTTTPGKVRYIRGGVGRNIAECMSKLGVVPFLISVVGQDMAGDLLVKHWQSLGLQTEGIRRCPEASTPVVSGLFDGKGELAGAVADVYTLEEYLTPDWIGEFQSHIQQASVLVLDANLSETALQAACKLSKDAKVPIWFEPVSVTKSIRHSTISEHLMFVSPNEAELVAMAAGCEGEPESAVEEIKKRTVHSILQFLQPHIVQLLNEGMKFVVLTLGSNGIVLCFKSVNLLSADGHDVWLPEFSHNGVAAKRNDVRLLESSPNIVVPEGWNVCLGSRDAKCIHFPALPATVVSLSGAGDCFVAGAITALCMHQGLYASIAFGVAVAQQAVQSELNVPATLCATSLTVGAQTVLSLAKQLRLCPD